MKQIDIAKIMGSLPCSRFEMGWTKILQEEFDSLDRKLMNTPKNEWTIYHTIEAVRRNCLDYYKHVIEWKDYLRGESKCRPKGIKHPTDGTLRHLGEFLTGTIEPALVQPVQEIIENLPSLNAPGKTYPYAKLKQMLQQVFLLSLAMDRCEEEMKSTEGSYLGLFCLHTYELFEVVCVPPRKNGRVVLEQKLIKAAFVNFYKSACNAAWAIVDKVERRDAGKIDLSEELEALRKSAYDPKEKGRDKLHSSAASNVDIGEMNKRLKSIASDIKEVKTTVRSVKDVVVEGRQSPHQRSGENQSLVRKALEKRAELISNGTKERDATSAACKAIERKCGIGKYRSFNSFRAAVNDEVQKINREHGIKEVLM